MRSIAAGFLLAIVLGCNEPAPPAKDASQASASPKDYAQPGNRHIEMPVRDIVLEMQQHCSLASARFQQVRTKIEDALAHGDADETQYKIKKLSGDLRAVQENMDQCTKMAHGIYEKQMNAEPPKLNPR